MSDFNRRVGKIIDSAKREKLKENWRKTKIITQSSFVGADILMKLLGKPGAVGLRIYYGMDDEGNMHPIFHACDASGKPVISATASLSAADDDSDGADASLPCPPYCP